MAGRTRGKRSPVTCHLKCDDACARAPRNTSANQYFRDIASAAITRRRLLGAGTAAGLSMVVAACSADPADSAGPADAAEAGGSSGRRSAGRAGEFGFERIEPVASDVDSLEVPPGYTWTPIVRWGDPLFDAAPEFDITALSAAAQRTQVGYNNDFLAILPTADPDRAILYCNHEYVNPQLMFPAAGGPSEQERHAIEMAAHGGSIVELERSAPTEPWRYVRGGGLNRRITATTAFELTGPAAGSDLVTTAEDPSGTRVRGMVANCAGGSTPWGTVLSGEENFNGYFRAASDSPGARRYGLTEEETTLGWERTDPRFDARGADYRNEPHRYGYVVEIDPQDPQSAPVKHTALGRLKHEGATIALAAGGQAVAYMGDDEAFDYLYKFVSRAAYRDGDREHNKTLLTEGNLYVAQFTGNSAAEEIDGSGQVPADGAFDGRGTWIPLVQDGASAVPGMSLPEVLVHTRLAADQVGATKMDRCEDVEPNPATGRVYVACTNNTDRGTDGYADAEEANPRHQNRDGHVVEITESGGDAAAEDFTWNLLLVCGDPSVNESTYFSGYPQDEVSPISCPDNLAFDRAGNLWISTDGAADTLGYNDGLFRVRLEGPERGLVEQFLSVPREAETCGPVIHDEEGHVFVSVQHPGEEGTLADPHSYFPDYVQGTASPGEVRGPRPAVVQVYRVS